MNINNSQFKILIIDDLPAIHEDFKKILTSGSPEIKLQDEAFNLFSTREKNHAPQYIIDSAYQGTEGLTLVQKSIQENRPYAVMFVDVRMPPGCDGIETIAQIWKIDPDIQTVICTAYSDYSWGDIFKKFGATDRLLLLKKPFDNSEVRQFVTTLTKKWFLTKQVRSQIDSLQMTVEDKTSELLNSLSLLRATFESSADGILVTNMQDAVTDYNSKFLKLWNIPKAVLDTRKFSTILAFMMNQLEYPGDFLRKMHGTYKNITQESFDLINLRDKRIFECSSLPQRVNETIIGRVWNFRDITERRKLEDQLAYQATHDVLTGLYNRILLLRHVEHGIADAKLNNTHIFILFFDLDHFKLINDSLGHSQGDKLLKAVASRLKQCARPNDTLARLGGDEFVVLVNSLSDENEINPIIKRFFDSLKNPFNIDGNTLNITTSAGISIYPKDGKVGEILFKNADAAMYRAKEMGRNNFQFYTASMNLRTAERLELGNNLSTALAKHELLVYYQPLLDLKTEAIIGVEALIRWQHPKRGLVMPVEFIPIAEETGLIVPIGEWVMQTACKQIKAWHDKGIPDIWVAVNLSANQFKHSDIVKTVSQTLKETQLEAKYLCLEMTENLVLEDTEELRTTLEALKTVGVTLAIDDFGVGYSNLNYITRFPIDKLKIDKSFMRDVVADVGDAAIVLAVLGIARGLSMTVLAEGVETHEQLKFLQKHECDEFQGFLVSEAVDAEACEKILVKDLKKK